MKNARELAEQAIRIGSDLQSSQVEGFKWQSSFYPGFYHVTLYLTDGSAREYSILEERQRDAPNGESRPW